MPPPPPTPQVAPPGPPRQSPPPPPPKGASGQQLVGRVVGVQNRGVAPPGGSSQLLQCQSANDHTKKHHMLCLRKFTNVGHFSTCMRRALICMLVWR